MLKKTGFKKMAPSEAKPRLIVAVDGREKQGKTHFSLTAPGPIAYLSMDQGDEGVVDKFLVDGKEIWKSEYPVPLTQEEAKRIWDPLEADYFAALKQSRTLVADTATDIWEVARLSILGRLDKVPPQRYVTVNAIYRRLIREAYSHSCNVILLHRVKKEYKESKGKSGIGQWTGSYMRSGFDETRHLVQLNMTCYREPDGGLFGIRIDDCRQNPDLAGMDFDSDTLDLEDNGFLSIAQLVYPETDEEDWL